MTALDSAAKIVEERGQELAESFLTARGKAIGERPRRS
jgi:hypothetical protein